LETFRKIRTNYKNTGVTKKYPSMDKKQCSTAKKTGEFEFFFYQKGENQMIVLGLIRLNGGFRFYPLLNIEKLINKTSNLFPLPTFSQQPNTT
jgi:hypothetical protein